MHVSLAFALAFGIGVVAGLRCLTAPAVVSWAARVGCLKLDGSPLAFMGSTAAAALLALMALGEYVVDLMPGTPNRTTPGPLLARMVTGGLSGACVTVAASQSLLAGAVLGASGGVAGAFLGYQVRTRLVKALAVKDAVIAIAEDILALGLALLFVSAR